MDLITVQRRDEGLVQQVDRVVRDAIGFLFRGLHAAGVGLGIGQVVDQHFQLAGGGHRAIGMLVEVFEELALGGHESAEHGMFLVEARGRCG